VLKKRTFGTGAERSPPLCFVLRYYSQANSLFFQFLAPNQRYYLTLPLSSSNPPLSFTHNFFVCRGINFFPQAYPSVAIHRHEPDLCFKLLALVKLSHPKPNVQTPPTCSAFLQYKHKTHIHPKTKRREQKVCNESHPLTYRCHSTSNTKHVTAQHSIVGANPSFPRIHNLVRHSLFFVLLPPFMIPP
jgi:hypothetical protein